MPKWNIIKLNSVDSTNNYANLLLAENQDIACTAIITTEQTGGKGMAENKWESEKGKNLTCSIVLKPRWMEADQQFYLSRAISLAIVDFIEKQGVGATIKWPNDIYIGNKKVAGILIENSVMNRNLYSCVIGIGLNLNQTTFCSNAPNPVSMKQITGVNISKTKALKAILNLFDKRLKQIENEELQQLKNEYHRKMYRYKQSSRFAAHNKSFEACINGTTDVGELEILLPDGRKGYFMFKEIEFIL